ncbi:MAG: methyltransferase domain-containing protein [Candidatus Thermoplasmatota archaeon]|nr:methyltransferase domain-containing protein [Candidatus Thermoplasmatota archaeon]
MACPVCNCKPLHVFWELSDVPIFCNLLWTNQNEARNCQKGEVRLAFCGTCGHIVNVAFDPDLVDYSQIYENPLDFSPRFQVYTQSLANLLIERYELHDKDIISIGCGNGHFLSTLCEIGNNRGVGFDPSLHERTEQLDVTNKIKLIKDYYSEQYSAYPCDLVVCRHVLEHIHNPKNFLMTLRHTLDKFQNTVIFFEVPNAVNIFRNLFVWDIIYEHYSYFTPTSLACLFLVSGFNVSDLSESYESQFLGINATLSDKAVSDFSKQARGIDHIARGVARFASSYNDLVNEWRQKLEQRKDDGQRVVIWGTGSKGVTFLNAFKNSPIEYAVDINPKKQGKFVAGTGQLIVSPQFLRDYKPDFVVVMNPIYGREIQNFLDTLGVSATIEYPLPSVYGK